MRASCGKIRPATPSPIHFMQFAFRWQSYGSSFCMNKIVCRYCDLLIAKSFQCMYFFREK
jgi:hypothetical protein